MTASSRRKWMGRGLALAAPPVLGLLGRLVMAQALEPQVVKLVAQRFRYTSAEFRVIAGRQVVLQISSLDFVHGFHMPGLKLRADLLPGMVTTVRFTPVQPGVYEFLCDNFCGDKHEEMTGRMVVEAPAV